jgi:hypothetical protein
MGSLILVLLVMDRKAHKAAQARAQREAARLVEESAREQSARQAEREQLKQKALKEWEQKRAALNEKLTKEQIDLQLQMRKVREELQGIAARLHYEQDTTTQLRRKSQDERSRLQAEEQLLRTLRSSAKSTENQSKESSQALRRMTLDLLQMEQVLKDLKASKQREQKTFSVVPYHGRRGESRRPLYVECTSDGVIFHPERKAMSIVALIPGSSNSASEVRAEVERRIAQQRQKLAGLPNNVDRTPYLLLLLRPSGVTTYHYFQRALRGLPLDFGYEFIDEDWVLDFPTDDELPSKQPWMVATNTPSRPAVAPPVAAAQPPRASPRPMGGVPTGNSVAAFSSGIRGFRASEGSGGGAWVKGDGNPPGTPASGTGGGSGGAGPGIPGGGGGSGGAGPGMPGGNGVPGYQTGFGAQGTASEGNRLGSSGGLGSPIADSSGRAGTALGSGVMGTGPGRGTGHGHPSAMPPTFPREDGGGGDSGEGVASGDGGGAIAGLFPLRGSNSGSGTGPGFPTGGSPGGSRSDVPGLGPPRALTSGPGEGYAGGGGAPNGIGGSDSTGNGNGIPGNAWSAGGAGQPNSPGSVAGAGTSPDGRYVIARGNGGDGPGPGFNGGGGGAGTGGPAMSNTFGSGGSTPGASIGFGPQFGAQGVGSASSGTQGNVGGSPGGQTQAGSSMPVALGSGGSALSGAPVNNGAGSGMQGAGGVSSGSGQAMNGVGGATNAAGTQMSGAPTGDGSSTGAQTSIASNPNIPGVGSPSPGGGGSSSGGPIVIGGTPSGQAPTGGAAPANGSRSSDVVILVDPLTGRPTDGPRPAPAPNDGSSEAHPQQADGNHGSPRIRVVPANGAASEGGPDAGDDHTPGMNRFMPAPSYAPAPPRRLSAPRPGWIHGGRDWTIFVECGADRLVLYPSQRTFPLAQAIRDASSNPLVKEIQQMIDRRQSSRRPGEPPFHPQVCLLVRPEHVRTFLTVYPALEALPVPKTRRNLDADDDVISIVTGAVP